MATEEQVECPLCMEVLDFDDINFYPCTCGYQICRFCWHRLKTDSNGLCPACRKPYSENPAHFEPLSEEEIIRIKKDRRLKELQKKQKLSENRRHLSDVRVVQKNLVFIVGLSQRLADADVLKKYEYFGKYGKILKVVINPSPSYAGTQTPSASAYVTYSKAEEALRAIQNVNNLHLDNRTLKASLGTTKYCSHFLKSTQCPKPDCMYLHDLGEDAASFTKEEMSQGKHLEYESKLIENILHIPRNLQNISTGDALIINSLNHQSNNQQINVNNNYDMNDLIISDDLNKLDLKIKVKQKSFATNNSNNTRFFKNHNQEENIETEKSSKFSLKESLNNDKIIENNMETGNLDSVCELDTDSIKILEINSEIQEKNKENPDLVEVKSKLCNKKNIKILNSNDSLKDFEKNEKENYNSIFLNKLSQDTLSNQIYNEEDLGFDPWGESNKALQDLIKIEKKTENNIEKQDALVKNLSKNFNSQKNDTRNLSPTRKTILNHIEFLQKQFQEQEIEKKQHFNSISTNKSLNQFSSMNEPLTKSFENSVIKLNNNDVFLNKNYHDQEYFSNYNKLNLNQNNMNEVENKQILKSFNSDNNYNKNKVISAINNSNVVPPPGFTYNSMNIKTINATSNLTPSSSFASSSSSNSSSLNNSASSTPALSQNSIILKTKQIPNDHNLLLNNGKSNEIKQADSLIQNKNLSFNSKQSELFIERKNFEVDYDHLINYNESDNLKTKNPTGEDSYTNNLHKTLKSILPNANISFGNFNNNDKNHQLLSSGTAFPQINLKDNESSHIWSDDPAIVSLTNRFNSVSNINNLTNLKNTYGFGYSKPSLNQLNKDFLIMNNSNNSSLTNNSLNTFSTKNTINGFDHNIIINDNELTNENSNNKKNIEKTKQFLNEDGNVLKIENNMIDNNKNAQLNLVKNLYSNGISINNQNDLFLNLCQNNKYTFLNQINNSNTLNNHLSFQQQIFLQQLTGNMSSNQKMSTE